MSNTTANPIKAYDYKLAAAQVLRQLKRDRDRQVIEKRFGFDMDKRFTLEQIGREYGITRERVRQIERATLNKILAGAHPEVAEANRLLVEYLQPEGGLATIGTIAGRLGAKHPGDQSYVTFLATLAPDVHVVDEDDKLVPMFASAALFDVPAVRTHHSRLVDAVSAVGKPAKLTDIAERHNLDLHPNALKNLALASKIVTEFEGEWGLNVWPQVNPKSIRDKVYLILSRSGKPLHFSDIAARISESNFSRKNVTVQAVHNELIKDARFILIGRGIYALAEWGYTPGTVADIIVDILRNESPLHKDEIVRRVLEKRQVKTTTIVLNLQEKGQFERVAKATYKLKG